MTLITAADSVIDDIKQVLLDQGINETSLRLDMNIG
jgi:hypothetical protein